MSRAQRITIIWSLAVVLTAGVVFIALRGCTLMPWNKAGENGSSVFIAITRDFGRRSLEERRVEVGNGDSVMDALRSVADVETTYGGGFVASIDGLASSGESGSDWFYYVNGVLSGVGANEYEVRSGDSIWWDYHGWGGSDFVPAVAGCYPAPFTNGYAGDPLKTVIAHSGPLESVARAVGGFLEAGGAEVAYALDAAAPVIEQREGPVLALLSFEDALASDWARALLEEGGENGSFLGVENGTVVPLDEEGAKHRPDEELVAAVACSGSGIGDAKPVWLVLCDPEKGASAMERLLVTAHDALAQEVGVVVLESQAVRSLPWEDSS